MNTQLLLTFTTERYLNFTIETICSTYELFDPRIFILQNSKDQDDLFLTYNIVKKNYTQRPPRTILVHRKKETNTLYTINAINKVILDEVGVYDNEFEINWSLYQNSLLLTNDYGLRVISTKLREIIEI